MSFVALDSANTLNPVPRLLNLTLALFYACSTFVEIKLKGPTVFFYSYFCSDLLITFVSCSSFLPLILLLVTVFVSRLLLDVWKVTI